MVFGRTPLTHMDALTTYKITHLVGISVLALGTGGRMAGGENRKTFAIVQGIGLLVMLVTGFGLLAKLGLNTPSSPVVVVVVSGEGGGLFANLGIPHFAVVKTVLWVVIAMLPLLFRKLKTPLYAEILIVFILVGVMAYLGIVKPALW